MSITHFRKWYDVRKGKTVGLTDNREETRASVHKKEESFTWNNEKSIESVFYTDGSCSNKIGGAGFVFVQQDLEVYRILIPVPPPTTNNYCELLALYHAVKEARSTCTIFTDSEYSLKAVTVWYKSWIKNDWKTSTGKKVSNQKIIKKIINLLKEKKYIQIKHVYGHQGNKWNELADGIANGARFIQKNRLNNQDINKLNG